MGKRYVIGLLACLLCMAAWAQEAVQDSLQATDMMVELRELVVKGGLPNTRLKGNAMITRIEGTPLAA